MSEDVWEDIVNALEGTCNSLEAILESHNANNLLDDMKFLDYLEDRVARCECCDWWVEPSELEDINGTVMCGDCAEEEQY